MAEMNFDAWREDKVPPPGGVLKSYVKDRAVPQSPKQGAKYARTLYATTGIPGTYNYPPTSNRLSDITGPPAVTYGYDANGNVTTQRR